MSRPSRNFPVSIGFTINHLESDYYEEHPEHRPCVGRSAGHAGFPGRFIFTGKAFLRIKEYHILLAESFVLFVQRLVIFKPFVRIIHKKFVFRQIFLLDKKLVLFDQIHLPLQ